MLTSLHGLYHLSLLLPFTGKCNIGSYYYYYTGENSFHKGTGPSLY